MKIEEMGRKITQIRNTFVENKEDRIMNELEKVTECLPAETTDVLIKGIELGREVGREGGKKLSDLIDWIVDLFFKK